MRLSSICLTAALVLAALPGSAQVYQPTVNPVDIDRWMYPFNGTPGIRNLAPTFSAVSDAPDFDNRDGQLIVAVDTQAAGIPIHQGAANYNPLRIRVFATHYTGAFAYDPTYDSWRTYLEPSDPNHLADGDAGHPIELYGVGFRNTYVAPISFEPYVTDAMDPDYNVGPPEFEESERHCEGCGAFGQAKRNIFPLDPGVPDPQGDVSNNVVRLAPLTGGGFDPSPWAIGKSTSGLAPGATVPQGVFNTSAGETFVFELNLSDPDVLSYVRNGLNVGALAFAITSMHTTALQAGGSNPNFYTRDNVDPFAIAPKMQVIASLPEPGSVLGLAAGVAALLVLRKPVRSRRIPINGACADPSRIRPDLPTRRAVC